ncbi:hypothetical protein F480_09680 [Bibersteinia trehalosi Y31]|uniref:23S rRNA pseudouridine synthase D n=1 Tax=Bibersteinia trehalosi Y31 TaxID=1261658 RepID=A0A179CYF0_BIBTR|nr:YajG family lipoprotein [Bibersteinia trehalosi]OAQ14597.1 hypothetical protein F480_09680 [Bibersteinia trehalosi Y31]
MLFSKKSFCVLTLFGAALLAGCQSQSNTILFTTPVPTASFNTQNQTAAVSVTTYDLRNSAEVASYTTAGNVQKLTAVPDIRQLFQQAMQQNLNSKGFGVVPANGNVNLVVNVKKFFANVEQGNLRHKISSEIALEVQVQGAKGNFTKNFNTIRAYEGAFGADNNGIRKVLNQTYSEIIQSIYNDNELTQAIHYLK